ncbi:MAG TPA: DUF4337 domain-containing protein [Candidatus Acidoferrum sp.]|nr:DUF4337 domain-containing protein [Candidatus Acidoferrum sp.]
MSEEPKAPWLNHVALTTVILAVCATLSTFKGGGYSTRSVISQEQASDEWNYYQAKSIRESLHTLQKENLEIQASLPESVNSPETMKKLQEAIVTAGKNIDKYEQQKKEIEAKAREYEAVRDDAQRNGRPFGIAVIFLQIGILLCSISALFKRKPLWYLAMAVGAVGLVYFADGFFLFMTV